MNRAQSLELIPDRETRTPAAHAASRRTYARLIERVLERSFPEWKLDELRTTMDLEHSFGPAYVRGMLTRGQSGWAVVAAGEGETQATIDGALTAGILWLAYCRETRGSRTIFRGLKIIVPRGAESTTRERIAWLNPELAEWELYALSQPDENLDRIDATVQGNLEMRLLETFDQQAALKRAAKGVARLMTLIPDGMRSQVKVRARNPGEVAISLHGLEFAWVRQTFVDRSFARRDLITFGVSSREATLSKSSEEQFRQLAQQLFSGRRADGVTRDPFFRLQPEKWLEEILGAPGTDLTELDASLGAGAIYSQVPAFAGSDRSVLDLLTVNREGRLAILELKASEDLYLPLQGLDYWIRVRFLHQTRGSGRAGDKSGIGTCALQRSGYFPGAILKADPPLLYYVVPALHVHPSLETVLGHFSSAVPWTLIAINERWRSGPSAVFRKRAAVLAASYNSGFAV